MRRSTSNVARTGKPRVYTRGSGWVAVALVVAGCQTTEVRSVPTVSTPPTPLTAADLAGIGAATADDGHRVSADDAVGTDPSAARLHDICGALLLYDAQHHHHLPQALDDLKPLADAGTVLRTTAPSGRPYLYLPNGLVTVASNNRIIVADPAPSPAGARWCIVLPPTPAAGAALTASVVSVPEATFRQYVPAE